MTRATQIWVDADACPRVIKDILLRAAERKRCQVIFVANQHLQMPSSPFVRAVKVGSGFDVADNHIALHVIAGDLVVTADIPLAAAVIAKGALALDPRGELYSQDNIRERLAMSDFMEEMRSSGQVSGGPAAMNQSDRRAFAGQLDKILVKW